jgi:hypothetical protein
MAGDYADPIPADPGKAERQKRQRTWLLLAILALTPIPFLINARGVEKRWEVDVHSGEVRVIRRGFWGGITEELKPADHRSAALGELFGPDAPPKWLLTTIRHYKPVPIPSRRRRWRDDERVRERGGMMHATMPIFSVLHAPHLSDEQRRELIDLAVDAHPTDRIGSTFHILPGLEQAVLNATEFPDEERRDWQAQIDDGSCPMDSLLKAAAKLPPRAP